MAEIKTGIFAKNVQKRLSRAQEKVLQKLGKADETKDEQFEQCVQNFKRQESEGSRLQREMKAYLAAVKGMQQASMNLTESLHEVYEPDWYGKDDVMTVGKNCDALWEDFHQRLVDSSLITLDTYLAQFPDIKNRVAKRSRKLIDYDSARHHLETLQASGIKNDRKITKAEEEFHKAQKVFDDLNVDLQEELPKLWDSRVGFYVNTFKNVTHLESKFHREISLLCRKLYEVMNKLGEQHSDKMFTIQGAPSDSGPLRFARTPTPPEDESPPASPGASPNHMLAPGPHRPRSPSQGRPPVPPPPKVTPTTEMQQEQIISLFDDNFAPAAGTAPPVQDAKAVDSLLDLDFDPFKPDATTPIGQTQSPISQTLPWDLWTAPAAEATQPGAGEWAADFSSPAATAELETGVTVQEPSQEWPPADGWGAEPAQPQEETAAAEVRGWEPDQNPDPNPDSDPCGTGGGEAEEKPEGEEPGWGGAGEGGDQSMPGIIFTNEYGQEIQDTTEGSEQGLYAPQGGADGTKPEWGLSGQAGSDCWSGSEYETADEWGDTAGQNGGWASAEEEPAVVNSAGVTTATEQPGIDASTAEQGGFADWGVGDQAAAVQELGGAESTGLVNEPSDTALFQQTEPADSSAVAAGSPPPAVSEPAEQAVADPFGIPDPFAEGDPFAQAVAAEPVLDFVSDPFAEAPGEGGEGWAADPFATEGGQMWPETWAAAAAAPAPAGGENWAFPGASEGQPNGVAQWAAFPDAATEGEGAAATAAGSPWQEVSGSSGFFSSDGQGDFAAGWGDGDQDPFAALSGGGSAQKEVGGFPEGNSAPPGAPFDAQGPRIGVEGSPSHKDAENNNSDLSEDEVANRRYGKLYQEVDTEKEEVSNNAFNGFSQPDAGTSVPSEDSNQGVAMPEAEAAAPAAESEAVLEPAPEPGQAEEAPAAVEAGDTAETSPPAETTADVAEAEVKEAVVSPDTESTEIPPPADGETAPADEAAPETAPAGEAEKGSPSAETPAPEMDVKESPKEQTPTVEPEGGKEISKEETEDTEAKEEKMPIPSVVIEPASSNEGDDECDGDITSPTAASDSAVTPDSQTATPGMPPGFLYKVETLHDFEAANSDELDLKKGDMVLVVPTELLEDQDAGWLTGIKESDWLQQGGMAQKGLFPENFTQRLE
ncbi:hypothetical protein MATL_G00255770 [Megalops atlanticus]|uniref:Amphiphysin n=1 Tax=Megalops atlanticus TaxID=7932 RepID=A0A9D3T0D8_MEGAT|nr:hypothetical protein MATL_G00255770 [Megalops atlanticus]